MLRSGRSRALGWGIGRLAGAVAMRDLDVRNALVKDLRTVYTREPDTLVVGEFGLCQGEVRVDLVVVNGLLNGFEIKTDLDTLERLPVQQEVYSKVLDTVTLIAGGKHIDKILATVPPWWGVHEAGMDAGQVTLSIIRPGRKNPKVDPFSLAQLLWRDEALRVMAMCGLSCAAARKPRRFLWTTLAEHLTTRELGEHVRQQIKSRTNWRSVLLRTRGGATCQSPATSWRYPTAECPRRNC
jgi:hypothetical protein